MYDFVARMVMDMPEQKIDTAYLIKINLNGLEQQRASFREVMETAEYATDVCVEFDGETKEFTLAEFGRLLGFKGER